MIRRLLTTPLAIASDLLYETALVIDFVVLVARGEDPC